MGSQLLDIARSYFLENDGPRRPLWIKDGPCRQGIFNDLEKIFAAYSAGGLEGNAQNHQRFARLEEVAPAGWSWPVPRGFLQHRVGHR
jgi:hypothetical protein